MWLTLVPRTCERQEVRFVVVATKAPSKTTALNVFCFAENARVSTPTRAANNISAAIAQLHAGDHKRAISEKDKAGIAWGSDAGLVLFS
jgi:hypothetical protein